MVGKHQGGDIDNYLGSVNKGCEVFLMISEHL